MASPAQATVEEFIKALRASEVRVSPAEAIDAHRALMEVGYADRTMVRDALCVTLAKSEDEVVADFTAQGYRLVGGRADYLAQQRSAVLVYEHGAHVINVFAFMPGGAPLPSEVARRGYHIACWRGGDLGYCAVSDAGWEELAALRQLLEDLAARDAR